MRPYRAIWWCDISCCIRPRIRTYLPCDNLQRSLLFLFILFRSVNILLSLLRCICLYRVFLLKLILPLTVFQLGHRACFVLAGSALFPFERPPSLLFHFSPLFSSSFPLISSSFSSVPLSPSGSVRAQPSPACHKPFSRLGSQLLTGPVRFSRLV